MPTQVIMPQLGESVVEGTLGRWLIAEGQPVQEYAPLLTVTTDKVDTEIPAPASGLLLRILVPEGRTVPAGTPLAWIGAAEAEIPEAARDLPSAPPLATPVAQRMAAEHGVDLAQVKGTGPAGRVTKEDVAAHVQAAAPRAPQSVGFISPAVARLVAESGVDLAQVPGTGEGGRVTKKDVEHFVAAGPAELPPWERPGSGDLFKPTEAQGAAPRPAPTRALPPAPGDSMVTPLSAIRRSVAVHMAASVHTAPHVTTVMEADMTGIVQARERLRAEFARGGVRLTFTPFLAQAIIAGLRAVPVVNSSFTEEGLRVHRRIHLGMAVAIADGLIVPVIRDADALSLLGLARAVNDLAERARSKQLKPEEAQGGTFTLTNHGTAGSLFATPIINQPQAGILGVGAIRKRPIVVGGGHPLLPDVADAIAIRPMAYLSFTFDHRVLDGQEADSFLEAVVRFLGGYPG